MFMQIAILDRESDIESNVLDDMVASALVPLIATYDDFDFLAQMCAESIAAIECGSGKMFMIREENRSLASACVFLPYPGANGCYHLSHIGTYQKHSRQGIGRLLMNFIIDYAKGGTITVESSDSSRIFFEKLGFKFREKSSANLNAMYLGQRDDERFLKVVFGDHLHEQYTNRALNAFTRIGFI